jgi:DNA (cytosine-5)-methyltransferase 1
MTHLGLFEGIGGFSLAAKWMGWETLAWCEWNEFGQKVLRYHFPEAEGFGDITKTDFKKYANKIDILTGGFPCQPYSMAGKRLGKEDDRHLWPEMLRVIREVQPTWVVGENVFGLVNWSGGLVFHEVQADLEAEGYEVQPYVLPAVSVNAPHRRDRVWFVANSNKKRFYSRNSEEINKIQQRFRLKTLYGIQEWQAFPSVSPICNGDDGLSHRLDSITFSKWRNESIKAGGNAIVPQVAYQIFKAIEQYNNQ